VTVYIPSLDDWLRDLQPRASEILVFQNVYNDNVIPRLDPSFLPIDGRRNARTATREVGLFLRMFHTGLYQYASLTGIVSPQFNEKTKITGPQFFEFVLRNPGYNVYFVNPFPQSAYYTYNVWYHGDLAHGDSFMALAQTFFEAAGFDTSVMFEARDSHATLAYSSYWVGDAYFWENYMSLIVRLMRTLRELHPRLLHRLVSDASYDDWQTSEVVKVSNLPFIFERSFSTYLHMNSQLKALAYPFTREEVMDHCYGGTVEREIVRTFGDVVDEIDRRGEYTAADRKLIFSLYALRGAASAHRWG
jgi:hypothetical protein